MRRYLWVLLLFGCSNVEAVEDAGRTPWMPPDAGPWRPFEAGTTDWDVGVAADAGAEDTGPPPEAGIVDGGAFDAGGPALPDYFPLAVGASWTFLVTEPNRTGMKTQTVLRTEERPGVGSVFILESQKPSGKRTTSVQTNTGTEIVRYEETSTFAGGQIEGSEVYVPDKLRVPNDLPFGVVRTEVYTEEQYDGSGNLITTVAKTEQWLISGVETVTVPAGTFEAVRVARRNVDTGTEKTYWFADGVGKIRELSIGQTEELVSWQIP